MDQSLCSAFLREKFTGSSIVGTRIANIYMRVILYIPAGAILLEIISTYFLENTYLALY